MFVTFFHQLRARGVPVSIHEWLAFLRALNDGLLRERVDDLYVIGRALLVKHEAHFDAYDQTFLEVFRGIAAPAQLTDEIAEWLSNPVLPRDLSPEEKARLDELTHELDELRKRFEETLREQTERHDGGNRWIGTGGTSPFGSGGYHPNGIRVGPNGGGQRAMQVASERRFRNYRSDVTLDIRSMQVALKRLRRLRRSGPTDELDVETSVDETCRNAGELELVFARPRKNEGKLLLLMDAGGSMTPYARLVSALFSAAHGLNHFKEFRHYTFHNCVYERLFVDIAQRDWVPTERVLAELPRDTDLIIVGDASMHPYELTMAGGAIDYWHHNETPGIEWLRRLDHHFRRSAWLNPLPERYWTAASVRLVESVFDMYPLTVEGISRAIDGLLQGPQGAARAQGQHVGGGW